MRFVECGSAAIACALLAGCSADPTGIQGVPSPSEARTLQRPDESGAHVIARALALGMKAPKFRIAVRDAMRASLVTEHKLVLQEFAKTPTGRDLLIEGAERMKISVDSIDRVIAQLPALDFYVPSEAHRRNWTGGPAAVYVGFLPRERGAKFESYDLDGAGGDGVPALKRNEGATFLLQYAQRKSRRINPQPSVPGTRIQDENDGDMSGSFVEYLPDGTTRETQLADYYANNNVVQPSAGKPLTLANLASLGRMAPPTNVSALILPGDGGGGGGGTTAPRDTTFLQFLIVISVCDLGSCVFGHNEFEWHTYYSSNNGSTWGNRMDLRIEGVPANDERTPMAPALFKKIRYSYEKITSDVVETDSWGDDHFTPSPIWSYGEAGRMKSEGADRCGYPKYYGGYYDCYDFNLFHWREVNQNMAWNPY